MSKDAAPKKFRVLIVEDDSDVAGFFAEVCRLEGHAADVAESGTEALALLTQHVYDAALLDARMPPPDGPDLYREIEQRQPALSRHVAFITGDILNAELKRRLTATGAPIREKPMLNSEMRQLLRQLLGGATP